MNVNCKFVQSSDLSQKFVPKNEMFLIFAYDDN